jgi:hypothetical protein
VADTDDPGERMAALTAGTFTPHIGETFALADRHGNRLDLTLRAVTERPESGPANAARTPFELILQGPADRWVEQGTYILRHDTLGDFPPLLVVPILDPQAPLDDAGRQTITYQICVN